MLVRQNLCYPFFDIQLTFIKIETKFQDLASSLNYNFNIKPQVFYFKYKNSVRTLAKYI
jgi:hypothetical protein